MDEMASPKARTDWISMSDSLAAPQTFSFPQLDTDFVRARQPVGKRLLIALHGLGDSIEGYRWLPEALNLRWMNYLLVNAPDDYYGGFSWYDLYGDADSGVRRSRGLLSALLDSLAAAGFPSEETVLFGFSQGCLMTLDVGLRHSRPLAGLAGVSGYVHRASELIGELSPVSRQQKVLVTHGTQDPLIACSMARSQMESLRVAGVNLTWREFNKVHTIAGEEELAVIREFVAGCFP